MTEQRLTEQLRLVFIAAEDAQASTSGGDAESVVAKREPERRAIIGSLMEAVCERDNLKKALRRVKANKGSPGIDGMTVEQLPDYLRAHWPRHREELRQSTYTPSPVRRVEIPKPDGGVRKLGVPTALDRFVQQAVLQVLQPIFDPTFSNHSYGFRPGRSAHQAVAAAQEHLASGYRWVVDLDLEKFFDRVNHDLLMGRLAQRVPDARVLKLIRAFLNAGVLENGLFSATEEGTPQGGPLSPLLSNIVLHALDCELEGRGHRFVRYADDCNVYVRSARAGHRVMASITGFITTRLKLKVNAAKSAVAAGRDRTFLGFSFTHGQRPKRRLADKTLIRFRARVRTLTRRVRGVSLRQMVKELAAYVLGWRAYFGFCQTPTILRRLDKWIRRRLRAVVWNNGSDPALVSDSCGSEASTRRMRFSRPAAIADRGACPSRRRSAGHCPACTSTRSACPTSSRNDRSTGRTAVVRTRMPGGVGGVTSRGVPLSRSASICLFMGASARRRAVPARRTASASPHAFATGQPPAAEALEVWVERATARNLVRIKSRTSSARVTAPAWTALPRPVQPEPRRWHATTVAGSTMTSALRQSAYTRESQTQRHRSGMASGTHRGRVRCSTCN